MVQGRFRIEYPQRRIQGFEGSSGPVNLLVPPERLTRLRRKPPSPDYGGMRVSADLSAGAGPPRVCEAKVEAGPFRWAGEGGLELGRVTLHRRCHGLLPVRRHATFRRYHSSPRNLRIPSEHAQRRRTYSQRRHNQ